MDSWVERVRRVTEPAAAVVEVRPLLSILDAWVAALRDRGWDAWVSATSPPDAVLRLHAAREGREGTLFGFLVGHGALHELRPRTDTYTSVDALADRLVDHSIHTGGYAWISAGRADPSFVSAWSPPRGWIAPLADDFVRVDSASDLVGGPGPDEEVRQRLFAALDGLDRFQPQVDDLLGVLDELVAGATFDTGVELVLDGPSGAYPEMWGAWTPQVAPDHSVSWLHFEVERTGLRPEWPGARRVTRVDELRRALEEVLATSTTRSIGINARRRETRPLRFSLGGDEVLVPPSEQRELWRALRSGRTASIRAVTTEPSVTLGRLSSAPVDVPLGETQACGGSRPAASWRLDPARCSVEGGALRLVGEGEVQPAWRSTGFPDHVPTPRSAWSARVEALLGPEPPDEAAGIVIAGLEGACAAASTLPGVHARLVGLRSRDTTFSMVLERDGIAARVGLFAAGSVVAPLGQGPPLNTGPDWPVALLAHLADVLRRSAGRPPGIGASVSASDLCSLAPGPTPFDLDRIRAALAPPEDLREEDRAILTAVAHELGATGRLAAWWVRSLPWHPDEIELRVRPSDGADIVAPVAHLRLAAGVLYDRDTRCSTPALVQAAVLRQLEGTRAREVVREIARNRERSRVLLDGGTIHRTGYAAVVQAALTEPDHPQSVSIGSRNPEGLSERLGDGPVDIAGVLLQPTEVVRIPDGVRVTGPARFVAEEGRILP